MFDRHPQLLRIFRSSLCILGALFTIWKGFAYQPHEGELFVPTICIAAGLLLMITAWVIFFKEEEVPEAPIPIPARTLHRPMHAGPARMPRLRRMHMVLHCS